MTTRRRFVYAEFVQGWRALAAAHGLDAATGQSLASADPHWWRDPALWRDPGPAHSVVEREAIANIAAEARALAGQKPPETLAQAMTREFRQIVREAMTEAAQTRRRDLPLRELHALRGVTVEEVAGQRMEVSLKHVA
jgi:hypothetical protein